MAFANTDTGVPGPSKNTPFFDYFPTVEYDINNSLIYKNGPHETVSDIFFRFGVIKNVINNTSSYYIYDVQESDTPELLAEQLYNDKGAGWIIIYANQIFDPQFDWPLTYDAFKKMIINKYGSVENSQTTIHHYEKIITRVNEFYGTTSVTRFVIDGDIQTDQSLDVPYDYYSELAMSEVNTYDIDGKTIVETIEAVAISNYDYELKLNDDKKIIKIIKTDYYPQIMSEYRNMMGLTIMGRKI